MRVSLEVDRAALAADSENLRHQEFFLPTWTPGSYLIREYSRHLGPVEAHDAESNELLDCEHVGKNRYRVLLGDGLKRLRLGYTVYCHELSVRTSDLTASHAYWNHATVLLWPANRGELAARIAVQLPDAWDFACGLPFTRDADGVSFLAANHDEAVDTPCLAGTFSRLEFTARGVPHTLALDGLGSVPANRNLVADVCRIIEAAADVFGGSLPYDDYVFLCLFADRGGGGLEHKNSSTLLASRTAMTSSRSYKNFLGLVAHEHFHVWNVKRMRPEELWDYDYERENYTSMLWLAEGFTAYYDDLLCLRTGVLTSTEYLTIVARNLTNLLSGAGRRKQSLSDASFDAWIRLYRPDENTSNATQNYYGNGAIIAMVLDLTIRKQTAGERCLDDAVRALYTQTFDQGRGYQREDVVRALTDAAGTDLSPLLSSLVDEPLELDLGELLAHFGIAVEQNNRDRPHMGLSFDANRTTVSFVSESGPAYSAGIAPGDEILAIDGLRATSRKWSELWDSRARVGEPLRVLISSRGIVEERTLTPSPPVVGSVSLQKTDDVGDESLALRRAWLNEES